MWDTLPSDVVIRCGLLLSVKYVAMLSTVCKSNRETLWSPSSLWKHFMALDLGPLANTDDGGEFEVGPDTFAAAVFKRKQFADSFEIRRGGVDKLAGGMQVVACPCLTSLHWHAGTGAQGAIRAAAGQAFEAEP